MTEDNKVVASAEVFRRILSSSLDTTAQQTAETAQRESQERNRISRVCACSSACCELS